MNTEQVVEKDQILFVGFFESLTQPASCGCVVKPSQAEHRAQQLSHRMERNVACVGLKERPIDLGATVGCGHRELTHHAALSDPCRTHQHHDGAVTLERPLHIRRHRGGLPLVADQR